ncbi:ABC transporter ATP-binding protein [Bacteroidota bacterium]
MENNNKPVITITELCKSFGSGNNIKQVLYNINMEIFPGQIIGYIGPNGAGKTTTVKILCGMLDDFEGAASVFGYDIRENSLEVKKRIGYIPESTALYEVLTPMEYLHFVGKIHKMADKDIKQKSKKLLKLFEISENADERMNTFSKGMKQKVIIISGFIHNPDIIFMDEPLSGLDANSVIVVKEMLGQLAKDGKTIFYSSHLMDVVEKISDRIILINEGRIIADGSFEELNSGANKDSLEHLFTILTGTSGHSDRAGEIVDVFENKELW